MGHDWDLLRWAGAVLELVGMLAQHFVGLHTPNHFRR